MNKPKVLVFGSTGMLGSAVTSRLRLSGLDTMEASRSQGLKFDAETDDPWEPIESLGLRRGDYIVNCIGLTKKYITEDSSETVARAIRLNSLFPFTLARVAQEHDLKVIQVATDCVFSGHGGGYSETSEHDAIDVYGKSKSLGEVSSEKVMHLRCSLIGPETKGRKSLFLEWVRAAGPNSELKGYINHNWNGLTSLAFAKIVAGIIVSDKFIPGLQHLVPADEITKYELVRLELELLERSDVRLKLFEAEESIDRTLATSDPAANRLLFALGGYQQVPTIREMMEELPWKALKER